MAEGDEGKPWAEQRNAVQRNPVGELLVVQPHGRLGQLLAGQLGLTHAALAASASYALPEGRCRRSFDGPHGAPL